MSSGECWTPALTGRPEGEEAEVQGEIRGVGVFVETVVFLCPIRKLGQPMRP